MKVTLPRQEFQDALAAVSTLTGGRTTKPILACVRLKAAADKVQLSATDGEAGLKLSVAAVTMKKGGEVVVSAARLFEIVREMQDVEVTLESDDKHCTIRGEGSEFKIFVSNPADFPPTADFDDEADLVIDGLALRRMIALTIYAAARETSRYAINGVQWEKEGKKLYLVATDGRRLARAGGSIREARAADFKAIIPSKALNVFERVFTPPKDAEGWRIDIKVTPNQVLIRANDRVLSTVLVEGNFPDYQSVIPRDNDKLIRLNRLEFHSAVRRAALLTTEESRAVRLNFEKNQLTITSQAPEQGEARVQMPAEYAGTPISIGFNPAFIGDALRVMTNDVIGLELKEGFRPGIIYGEDKADFLYVVMPVSLN